jgi:hypothetical protein
MMFSEDYPAGGHEVLSKPPLGKCSINVIRYNLPEFEKATSKMEAAMHFKFRSWTGVVRYSCSVSAPGEDIYNADTFSGGF